MSCSVAGVCTGSERCGVGILQTVFVAVSTKRLGMKKEEAYLDTDDQETDE